MNSSISRVSKKTFLDSSHTLKTENEYGMCMYVSCPIQRADFAGHSSPPASCNSTAAWVETSPKTTRTTFGFFLTIGCMILNAKIGRIQTKVETYDVGAW